MNVPDGWASLLLSAVNDAILFHENLLKSETLHDRCDYEAHVIQLHLLLDHLKDDYQKNIEPKGGIPLSRLFPDVDNSQREVIPFPGSNGNQK